MQAQDQSRPEAPAPSAQAQQRARQQALAIERYAALHRQLESGRVDDALRAKLIESCVQLDKRDEAVAQFEKLVDPALRRGLRRDLARRGWVAEKPEAAEVEGLIVSGSDYEPTVRDHLEDAVRYMCDGRMPWAAIGGTIAFPAVLGLGAVLTSFSDFLLVRLLAALPALFLLGMVGVIGKQVLLGGLQGFDDADDQLPLGGIVRRTPGVLRHLIVLNVVLLGPGAVVMLLDVWAVGLPLLAAGAFLLPIAGAVLVAADQWRALSPGFAIQAIRRIGRPYLRAAGAILPLLAPALLALALTVDLPAYTVIAIVGPLSVVPALMAARIMGQLLHRHRRALEGLVTLPGGEARAPAAGAKPVARRVPPPKPDGAAAADPKPNR